MVFAFFSIFALQMKTREIFGRFQILRTYFTRSSIGILVIVFYFIYRFLLNEKPANMSVYNQPPKLIRIKHNNFTIFTDLSLRCVIHNDHDNRVIIYPGVVITNLLYIPPMFRKIPHKLVCI